ncbi:MAG: hypothetical protein OHK006_15030 [Thermodesulfovibrionales bacterium]
MKILRLFAAALAVFVAASTVSAYDETYEKAVTLFKKRDYRAAIPYLEKFVAVRPEAAAYYMLGSSYYQLKELQKSKEYFDQAYLIDPQINLDRIPEHIGLSREDEALADELLDLSGMRKQVGALASIATSQIPNISGEGREGRVKQETPRIFREALQESKVYPAVVEVYKARFQRDHARSYAAWLKTPLGRKATKLELDSLQDVRATKAETLYLEYQKVGASRRKMLRRLEQATRASEAYVEIVSTTLREILTGMRSRLPENSRINYEEIGSMVDNIRSMPRELITDQILASLGYTYRDLLDRELEEVVQFYESGDGQWAVETSMDSIVRGIGKASREIGEKMADIITSKRIAM